MSIRTFAPNIGKRWVDDKGTTLMHRAAAILKPSLLEQLIEETEGSLYLQDQYGNLPIHTTAESGNAKNIELMLQKAPALLEEKNHRGVTPLIVATQYAQLEVIQLLHAKGADFNYFLPNGLFPLYMAIQKNFRAIALWMLDNVQQLNVNQELDSQMTSLHLAIQGEETELALKLIARGARCDIRRKSDGFTALHCAAKEGNVKVLAAILATPISVNLALESKKTPLMLAAEAGQLEAVKLLIAKGADVNAEALNGETALMLAICAGRKEVAMYLAQIAQVNAVNSRQQTASLLAVQYAMPVVADILIRRGEDISRLDRDGFNCLYYLVRNGEYARVKQLTNRGVSLQHTFAGQSLLAVAAQNGQFLMVYELEERKVPYKNASNFSLLHYAVMANEIEFLRKHYSSVKDLKSLALLAIQYQAKESLLFLFQKMPKKDCQSKELMLAAIMSNDEEIVNIILKDWDDINTALDAQGDTAAHIAVMHGAHRILPLLVESGARLDKPNQNKQTPYHLAIAQEDEDMLKRLFKLKLSKPEEWPQDLGQIEATLLNAKIMRILNKYKKYFPEKPKGAKPSAVRAEGLREKTVNPLPVGPILSEAERLILKLFKSSLKDADYGYALSLLAEHPILIRVLKSKQGGRLLTLLFANMSELAETVLSTEEEKEKSPMQHFPVTDSALEDLLKLLKQEGVNPAHYLSKHNVLIAIIKAKTDKEACYRFEKLSRYFPQALPILANDKSEDNKLGIAELCLSLNKEELFEKLDGYCQKLENGQHSSFYALHEAVLANNYTVVQRLLRRYPVDALNAQGQTPLMLAASIGSVSLVNLLLKHGAFIDKCDRFGRNALHYALTKPSIETALLVLPLLRNPNQADRFGITPMMKAALKGVVSVMRFLVETNHDIHSVDKYGRNALHYAALADQVESIAFLVNHKFAIDAVEAPLKESKIAKCHQKTPLMLAAEQGKENAVYELLRLEANPEKKDAREFGVCEYGIMSKNREVQDLIKKLPFYHDPERNLYLLHAAVMANETVIISELILSNANQNALNTKGQNALHIACIYDATEAASLLLKGGSLVLDALDKFGYAPIHYAAQKGYVRLIRLLSENGADLNQKTTKGETPLTLACLNSHEGAVIALLEQGADFRQPNQDGMSPMHLALLKGFFPIVRFLQEAGDTSLNTDDFSSVPEQERKIIKFNLTLFSADKASARKTHLMRFLKPHKPENPIPIDLEDKSLALSKRIS